MGLFKITASILGFGNHFCLSWWKERVEKKKNALIFKEVKKGEYNSTNSWHQ